MRNDGSRRPTLSDWSGSALTKESSLHQLSPYIGKMKSSMAGSLIEEFTKVGELLYDPFCGSGTVLLEGWLKRRNVVGVDRNPYAVTLGRGKLFPPDTLEDAHSTLDRMERRIDKMKLSVDLRIIPTWVRSFFHPETLREVMAWRKALNKNDFLLSCLLGILHHQRPGFLSFPSSHTVPYLRKKKYPPSKYPKLYDQRHVMERLWKKVERALKRVPELDFSLSRQCELGDARSFSPSRKVNAIITSPPYMRQLDYARDNRLRLWLVGYSDWKELDNLISPREGEFVSLMKHSLAYWHEIITPRGYCILVLGDSYSRSYGMTLPDLVLEIAKKDVSGYRLVYRQTDEIPADRRVRRRYSGNKTETIIVLRKA
ncbi:MAG TPA: DNA methyltransferase [Candidatus Kryptonia bacterium]